MPSVAHGCSPVHAPGALGTNDGGGWPSLTGPDHAERDGFARGPNCRSVEANPNELVIAGYWSQSRVVYR